MGNFLYAVCLYPYRPTDREGLTYQPMGSNLQVYGEFHMSFYGNEVEFKGRYFRTQEGIDQYLFERGIALRSGLVNLAEIRRYVGATGSIVLLEEIKYNGDGLSVFAVTRVKSLLKVAVDMSTTPAHDTPFLSIHKGVFAHARTKDIIPSNMWIPLYRPGSFFGEIPTTGPINLQGADHVIL